MIAYIMKTQIVHKMKYDLKGQPRSYKTTFYHKIIQARLFMDWFWWRFVWILISWWRQKFSINVTLCQGEVLWFFSFTLIPPDLITTLTYILMATFFLVFLEVWDFNHSISKNNKMKTITNRRILHKNQYISSGCTSSG